MESGGAEKMEAVVEVMMAILVGSGEVSLRVLNAEWGNGGDVGWSEAEWGSTWGRRCGGGEVEGEEGEKGTEDEVIMVRMKSHPGDQFDGGLFAAFHV